MTHEQTIRRQATPIIDADERTTTTTNYYNK